MSLRPFSPQRSLFEADVQFAHLFENQSGADRFRFFAEKILPQLQAARPKLEKLYAQKNGRPGHEPVLLLGATLLQFMERLPDRAAADACAFDLRWKMALGMEAGEASFDSSCLARFRQRLVAGGEESLGFEAALDAMRQAGYLGRKAKRQRLDSTHVVGLVSRMSRLEIVRETIRLALQSLEKPLGPETPKAWENWWERYVESKPDFRVSKEELKRRLDQVGGDVQEMLRWIEERDKDLLSHKAIALLRRVFEENFEVGEGGQWDPRRAQPPGAVHNPHDPQAQWSSKSTIRGKEWVGYKAQVAETTTERRCEPGEPTDKVITALLTEEAIASDKTALPRVEHQWQERKVEKPEAPYVDGGYTSGAELSRAQDQERELRGPMAPAPKKDGRFSAEDFDVCVEERKELCPQGRANAQCSRLQEEKTKKIQYRYEWSRKECSQCPVKAKCLGKGQKHRTLTVGEHHTLIQARRKEQRGEGFKEEMHRRNGIEATISELVRGYGLRRSRYRGLAKARLQNYMIASACNINRWFRRSLWETQRATA